MKNVFKKAHEITKNIIRKGDSYRETFRLALIFVYSELKKGVNKMLDLRKEISLNFTEEYENEVLARKQIKANLDDLNFDNIETNTNYITDEGVLIWGGGNDSWRLFFYKDKIITYTNNFFYKIVNSRKCKDETKKEVEKQVKKEVKKNYNICWECGSELDINDNCPVCGCSKEIYEF